MANVCVEPICSDGVQDGDETGIDCGGYCLPCPNADGCTLASDCESGDCKNLVCVTCAADADCPAGDFCDLTNQGGTCTAP
jgi:Cys-rich repeat protein